MARITRGACVSCLATALLLTVAQATLHSSHFDTINDNNLSTGRALMEVTDCLDGDCVLQFEQCGGNGFNISAPCCDEGNLCVAKNYFYAQCLTAELAEENLATGEWDGAVLNCEEMPQTVLKAPEPLDEVASDVEAAARRLLEFTDCMDGDCKVLFEQCGGNGFNMSAPCCDDGTACVAKNPFYAQCLTDELAEANIATGEWDGTVLVCEEMPETVLMPARDSEMMEGDISRKLLEATDCMDEDCRTIFEQCSGNGFNVSAPCCDEGTFCVVKNEFYAQCITQDRAEANVEGGNWDGRVLNCEAMPDDVRQASEEELAAVTRRLLDVTDCMDGDCMLEFEQCGGNGFNTSAPCCDDDTFCVVKNYYYAQCITAEKAEDNVMSAGWDGAVLQCEEMPTTVVKGPDDVTGDGPAEEQMPATSGVYGGNYGQYGAYGGGYYGHAGPSYGARPLSS